MRSRLGAYLLMVLSAGLGIAIWQSTGSSPLQADEKPTADATRPVPKEESNCVRCHLTAGRELTEVVHTFAHSVHDLQAGLSCQDCHGGNTEDDAKAHTAEFGFIGTKMSAHLAKCQECHADQYKTLAGGPHAWDQQKKLNIKYPLCVDCHGNHDVGNPPAEFSLTLVCTECHRGFKAKFPSLAALTDAEDEMWAAVLSWKTSHGKGTERLPHDQEAAISEIRKSVADFIHASHSADMKQVEPVVEKMKKVTEEIRSSATASIER